MSEEKKKSSQKVSPYDVASGFTHRLIAWLVYKTGIIERKRKEAQTKGGLAWRILCYQRIAAPEKEPYPLIPTRYVTPETFELQMTYLVKNCRLMGLEELIAHIEYEKPVPDKTVVITFDNGWRDTFDTAFPILHRYKIPTTVFLPTAFIDSMNLFWTDKIINSLLLLEQEGVKFPDLPFIEKIELPEGESSDVAYSMARALHLVDYLKSAPAEEKQLCFESLGIAIDKIGGLPMERMFLSWEEITEMYSAGVTFASNSHSHRLLGELSPEELIADLNQSLHIMQQHNIIPLPTFAYPDGEITKKGRETLYKQDIKYTAAIGNYPPPNLNKKTAAVLGRIPIYQSNTYTPDLFACHLWGINFLGHSY